MQHVGGVVYRSFSFDPPIRSVIQAIDPLSVEFARKERGLDKRQITPVKSVGTSEVDTLQEVIVPREKQGKEMEQDYPGLKDGEISTGVKWCKPCVFLSCIFLQYTT